MNENLKQFQEENCHGCYFVDDKKVGTGEPCCTYSFRLKISNNGEKCLVRRIKKRR